MCRRRKDERRALEPLIVMVVGVLFELGKGKCKVVMKWLLGGVILSVSLLVACGGSGVRGRCLGH